MPGRTDENRAPDDLARDDERHHADGIEHAVVPLSYETPEVRPAGPPRVLSGAYVATAAVSLFVIPFSFLLGLIAITPAANTPPFSPRGLLEALPYFLSALGGMLPFGLPMSKAAFGARAVLVCVPCGLLIVAAVYRIVADGGDAADVIGGGTLLAALALCPAAALFLKRALREYE